MKTMAIVLLIGNFSMANAWAGALDLPEKEPKAMLTLANGVVIPGGGWFYLSSKRHGMDGDFFKGVLFLGSTLGAIAMTSNAIKKDNQQQWAFGLGGLILVRWGDLNYSVSEAYRRHGP